MNRSNFKKRRFWGESTYTSLDGYFEVNEERGNDVDELKRIYEYWKRTHK